MNTSDGDTGQRGARLAELHALLRQQQWQAAEQACLQLLADTPRLTEAHYLLGTIYQHTGRQDRAIDCYETVLKHYPRHADALNNLGIVYESLQQPAQAQHYYALAASSNPHHLLANYNLARTLRLSADPRAAIPYLMAALKQAPDSTPVLQELGLAWKALGVFDQALHYLEQARATAPGDAALHNLIGNVFQSQGKIEQALQAYRGALQLRPDYASAHNNLGSALVARGDVTAAIDSYRTATRLEPGWAGAASNLLLAQNYLSNDAQQLFNEHQAYGDSLQTRSERLPPGKLTGSSGKIRVGYISPDFRVHSVAWFLEGILQHHDRSAFEISCFADVASPDGMTEKLQALVPEWHNIFGLSDREVAERVRKQAIDILVDLAGHTANNRLGVFAMQPAAVQISYLGYPNTTGLASLQYRFTDSVADPPGMTEQQYTERLVRLPECFLCYTPPADSPEMALTTPAENNGFVTFGSFNVLAKISPACMAAWAGILQQLPNSKLILKSAGLQDKLSGDAIHRRFAAQGVAPDRVELVARTSDFRSHMALYNRIDIGLDTFPYNGTTTTCEALWMGVPVIALSGQRHASRVGLSLLHQLGLDELTAGDIQGYIALAIRLSGDLPLLTKLRKQLRATMAGSPLCDGRRLARAIETEYQRMLRSG